MKVRRRMKIIKAMIQQNERKFRSSKADGINGRHRRSRANGGHPFLAKQIDTVLDPKMCRLTTGRRSERNAVESSMA